MFLFVLFRSTSEGFAPHGSTHEDGIMINNNNEDFHHQTYRRGQSVMNIVRKSQYQDLDLKIELFNYMVIWSLIQLL